MRLLVELLAIVQARLFLHIAHVQYASRWNDILGTLRLLFVHRHNGVWWDFSLTTHDRGKGEKLLLCYTRGSSVCALRCTQIGVDWYTCMVRLSHLPVPI